MFSSWKWLGFFWAAQGLHLCTYYIKFILSYEPLPLIGVDGVRRVQPHFLNTYNCLVISPHLFKPKKTMRVLPFSNVWLKVGRSSGCPKDILPVINMDLLYFQITTLIKTVLTVPWDWKDIFMTPNINKYQWNRNGFDWSQSLGLFIEAQL